MSGKESKVKEYLEAEMRNSDLGEYVSQVLIPTEKSLSGSQWKENCEREKLSPWLCLGRSCIGW